MRRDYHIHTEYLGCADETMKIASIADRCEKLGVDEIAITDHLNHREEAGLHRKIKKELLELEHDLTIYFGAELNFMEEAGEFATDSKMQEEIGFQFYIGGIHSAYGTDREPIEILKTQHQHHLQACRNELVSVLVHPYWFGQKDLEQMPWLTDLDKLPDAWIEELAETAIATGTAIEINYHAIFSNPRYQDSFKESYKEYLLALKELGVEFSVATDSHSLSHLDEIKLADKVVAELNIPEEQLWTPPVSDIREVE